MGIRKRILMLMVFVVLAVLVGWRQYRQILTTRNFVDEQDNFLVGKYLNQGAKVYREVFSHHQPIAYLGSALVQKISKPNTIYMSIIRHREAMIIWSMLGWLLLTHFFGWRGLGLGLMVEIIKIKYLGTLFLAESLVVYPLLLLLGLLVDKEMNRWRLFLSGAMLAFLTWSLAPLWLVVGAVGLLWIIRLKRKKTDLVWLMIGAGLVTGMVFIKIDFQGYVEEALLVNYKYYLPPLGNGPIWEVIYNSLMIPLTAWKEDNLLAIVFRIYLFSFGLALLWMWRKKKRLVVGAIIVLMAMLNLRLNNPLELEFSGFHFLPWLVVMLGVIWWVGAEVKNKLALAILGLNIISTSILVWPELTEKTDFGRLNDIYYSRSYNMAEAVKAVAKPNEKLLSLPDEPNWYWQSDVKPATRFIFFLTWMDKVEILHNEMIAVVENTKPEFLRYTGKDQINLDKYAEKDYQGFKYRGESSEFYILKTKWQNMTNEEINKLEYYGLEKDNGEKRTKN